MFDLRKVSLRYKYEKHIGCVNRELAFFNLDIQHVLIRVTIKSSIITVILSVDIAFKALRYCYL